MILLVIFVKNIHSGSVFDDCSPSNKKENRIGLTALCFVSFSYSLEDSVKHIVDLIESGTMV